MPKIEPTPNPAPAQSQEANLPAQQQNNAVQQIKGAKQQAQDLLNAYKRQIAEALPSILTPERMIRVALTAMSRTPDLLQCTQPSLISCVLTCAQLGLLPDPVIGEAYLIPFNNTKKGIKECTLIVGYKGLCTLAMRSGQVRSVQARAVYEGDQFVFKFGLDEQLDHIPCGESDQSKITHFYCVVKLLNGHVLNVMTRKEVEAIRDESANYKFSKYKNDTVWGKHFAEMGCKTVLRRLMKYVPLSPEVTRAIGLDEAADTGRQNVAVDMLADLPDHDQNIVYADIVNEDEERRREEADMNQDQNKDRANNASQATLDKMNRQS